MMYTSSTLNRRAFTLIELLVVVAIIVLLMAILLPSLGTARKNAQKVACCSNHRQVGMAVQMYAQENSNNLFPLTYPTVWDNKEIYAWDDGSGKAGPVTLGLLAWYLPGSDVSNLPNNTYYSRRKVLSCPAPGKSATVPAYSGAWGNYGTLNYIGICQLDPARNTDGIKKMPTENPGAIAVTGSGWSIGSWSSAMNWQGVDHHDRTGENVVYFDGHARFVTNSEMTLRAIQKGGSAPVWMRAALNVP